MRSSRSEAATAASKVGLGTASKRATRGCPFSMSAAACIGFATGKCAIGFTVHCGHLLDGFAIPGFLRRIARRRGRRFATREERRGEDDQKRMDQGVSPSTFAGFTFAIWSISRHRDALLH